MPRFFALGAFALALAVAAGAFGAHGLKARLTPDMLAHWETAVRYHAYHGLGLLAVAWAVDRGLGRGAVLAGRLMLAGMLLFSGSLYVYALTGLKAVAMVTPLGGVCFIAAWVALGVTAWRRR
ncbi:DUF423 domain-containing protein [Myxococcota bacterium]|nr:DUF423 domain-containing protein [Myxococcota bacterium]